MQDLEKFNTDTLTFRRYESGKVNLIFRYPLGDSGEDGTEIYRFVTERPANLDRERETTFQDGAGRTIRTGVYVNGEGHGFAVAWPQN